MGEGLPRTLRLLVQGNPQTSLHHQGELHRFQRQRVQEDQGDRTR